MSVKAVIICNNYGKTFDGIGAYSKVIVDRLSNAIEAKLYTSVCDPNSKPLSRILNLGMTKEILYASFYILKNQANCVIMEYPFIEWNPLIIFAYSFLSLIAKHKKIHLILSLHEYSRVSILRKLVIRCLVKKSEYLAVTNDYMRDELFDLCSNIFIRKIPSNIDCRHPINIYEKNQNDYVYFGLVGKSKAFDEMIEAWRVFNKRGDLTLEIISGTNLIGLDSVPGVKYYNNLPADDVIAHMEKCTFSIIPVRPYIDEKNATLKTSCIAGCIPIGVFSEELSYMKDSCINLEDYSSKSILEALETTRKMNKQKVFEYLNRVILHGKGFLPSEAASTFEAKILNICRVEHD